MSTVYTGVRSITASSTNGTTHVSSITTSAAHGLNVGDTIHVLNAMELQLNGLQVVSGITSGLVFTVTNPAFVNGSGGAGGSATVQRSLNLTIPSDGDGPGIRGADVQPAFQGIVDKCDDLEQQLGGRLVLQGIYETGNTDATAASWGSQTALAGTWQGFANVGAGRPSDLLAGGGSPVAAPLAQVNDVLHAYVTLSANVVAESASIGLARVTNGSLGTAPFQGSDIRVIPSSELSSANPTPVTLQAYWKVLTQCNASFGLLAIGMFGTTPAMTLNGSWQIVIHHYRPIG